MAEPHTSEPDERAAGRRRGADPNRRCVVSGRRRPAVEMLRFVVGPGDVVVPDIAARLPGRGIWLSADLNSIKTACDRNLFARAARRPVRVDDRLPGQVEELLARRCHELLGLARRAGQAVSGYVKVRGWLREHRAALLLAAADGAEDGRAKLRRIARDLPVFTVLRAAELGPAFGREETVHVAVASGGLAKKLIETVTRLSGFRGGAEYWEDNE